MFGMVHYYSDHY
uniref:Uncharacterized protein n=1 Tax=Anguilla anguilla TaxID=7936 RepID=A0A0E9TI63_ANGAN